MLCWRLLGFCSSSSLGGLSFHQPGYAASCCATRLESNIWARITFIETMSRAHLSTRSLTSSEESSQPLTVLITGCTSGIGEALAREFARQGHNIVGCGRRLKNLENLSNELGRNSFGQHHFFQCDVGDYNSVVRFREVEGS